MKSLLFGVMLAWLSNQTALAGWSKLENLTFKDGSHSDGDSIEVVHENKQYIFRLYFVDCLETNSASRDRRLAQAKYFGINSESAAMTAGNAASRLTRKLLQKPFTVYTRWEPVAPRTSNPAIRAFVETSDGRDLGETLVENGLAIIRSGRALSDHPDGRTQGQILRALREKETTARVQGRGAWKKQKPKPPLKIQGPISANQTSQLQDMAGHEVRVRGIIASTGALKNNRLTFLNFEGNKRGDFVVIIRGEDLADVSPAFPNGSLSGLIGARIEVSGLITLHRETPQIELASPSQLKVLE